MSDAVDQEVIYEYIPNPDEVIDQMIAGTGDEAQIDLLEDIKTWPDYAKTKWILEDDDRPFIQNAGCLALVVFTTVVTVLVWVIYENADGTTSKVREERERIKEVEKMVHGTKHKGGECPDDK